MAAPEIDGLSGPEMDDLEEPVTVDDPSGDDSFPGHITYSISSYGADYPIDGLVKRMRQGDVLVPDFQRRFVWSLSRASRFIESILLGLPVPGIFLSKSQEDNRFLVIDGQQRLQSLRAFYDGVWPKTERAFRLVGVSEPFAGKRYVDLAGPEQRRLDDGILHATVIKQETPDGDGGIYHIFERLNTGGMVLQPQEIRSCIYHGSFNAMLHMVNEDSNWREVYGPSSPRLRDQELILRFLALLSDSANYREPMKEFLNCFMKSHQTAVKITLDGFSSTFLRTISLIKDTLDKRAFRIGAAINAAAFDAIMVGLARRQMAGPIRDPSAVARCHDRLLENAEFLEAVMSTTADATKVAKRLELATKSFSTIP